MTTGIATPIDPIIVNTTSATASSSAGMLAATIAAIPAIVRTRFFGFSAERTIPAPNAFAGVKASIAPIHLGITGSSPSWLPRHCFAASRRGRHRGRAGNQVRELDAPPSSPTAPATSSTIAPASATPLI